MSLAAVRTSAVAILAVAVAVRVSLSQPATGTLARIAADPGGWLSTSTSGWTSAGTLGSATAQGVRDLPLGLFVWVGNSASLPPHAVQAVWFASVVLFALVGALRLTAERSWAAHVAAVLYACGPVLLAALTRSPSDGLVAALLPWIVAPLVARTPGWRPAAASAAGLGLAGIGSPHWAVAAAVAGLVAAAPLARSDLAQLARWALLAVTASAWWVATTVWEAVHATDVGDFLADRSLLDAGREALGGTDWSAGWLVSAALAPAGVAVAALVLRIRWRARALSIGLLGAGLLGVAAHLAGLDLPVPSAAVTTGDPSWTAPLLAWIAVAGLVAWPPLHRELRDRLSGARPLPREMPRTGRQAARAVRQGAPAAVAAAVVAASFVGFALAAHERADPAPAATELWEQVAQWSDEAPPGRVLVLPAVDDRLEPVVAEALVGRPWVARDSVPLSGAAATMALDDAIWRLSRGLGGRGTEAALVRLGITYVIVRNDLPTSADRARPSALVRHALLSQGASRLAVLSAADTAASRLPNGAVTDFGVRSTADSIEVWSTGHGGGALLYDDAPLVAAGDPGTATDLADAGLSGSSPVTVAPADQSEVELVSDAPRRRDIDLGEALEPFGPYLTADAPAVRPPGAGFPPTASRRLTGVDSVTASSSAADLGARPARPGSDPAAAVDGNVYTAWHSGGAGPGEWWEAVFLDPTDLSTATAQLAQNPFAGAVVTRVRLEYDSGATEIDVPLDGLVSLTPAGATTRLRIVATEFGRSERPPGSFGISELSVPGLTVRDELVVDGPTTASWVLAARPGSETSCAPATLVGPGDSSSGIPTACDRGLALAGPDTGPITRSVLVDRPVEVAGRVWMRANDSRAAGRLARTLADPSIVVTGTSAAATDLVTGPQAAADDDDTTAWRPAPEDQQPSLTLAWDEVARVTGLRLVPAPGGPASTPTRVRVQPAGSVDAAVDEGQEVDVAADGTLRIDPVRTDELTLTFLEDDGLVSVDTLSAGVRQLPIAIAEIEVRGGPPVTYDGTRQQTLPCGSGPVVELEDRKVQTAATVSARELVRSSVVQARLCERVSLSPGETSLTVRAPFRWSPLGIVLSPPDGPFGAVDQEPDAAGDGSHAAHVDVTGSVESGAERLLELPVDPGGGTLVVAVPAGRGWEASAAGDPLRPVPVDGWAQGWLVPAGAEQVLLDYSPARSLRWAAGAGLLGWVAVLAVAATGSRGWKRRRDQAIVGRSTQS